MVCLNKRRTLEVFCFKRVAKTLSIAVNIFQLSPTKFNLFYNLIHKTAAVDQIKNTYKAQQKTLLFSIQ